MSKYHFKEWPFPEDAVATVYWVTSPVIIPGSGAKTNMVYFQLEAKEELFPVEEQWGMIPELWIGHRFMNGAPIEDKETVEGVVDVDAIESPRIMSAAHAIPSKLYPLFKMRELCGEYCVSFGYKGQYYVVPCMELARAFYAKNSILAKQLISSGGLDELIVTESWNQDGRKVEFDFSNEHKAMAVERFAKLFAMLYAVPELKQGWEGTYVSYVKDCKICTSIPQIREMKLSYCGITHGGCTLITKLQQIQMPLPFDEVLYGPEILRASGKESSAKGHIPKKDLPDDVEVGEADATAKAGRAATLPVGLDSFEFLDEIHVCRKKGGSTSETRAHSIKAGEEKKPFSTGEQVGVGDLTPVNIDASTEVHIPSDPDFSLFCEALEQLAKYHTVKLIDVAYDLVPSGKGVSYLEGGMSPRRYACAELGVAKKRWIIIELCLKDGYSLSTLFIRTDKDKKALAKQMLGKLLNANGHWSKDCFGEGITHRVLDHRVGREAERWAELMYSKMH